MTRPASDHFNGKRFFYPRAQTIRGFGDLLRWKLTSRPARWPRDVAVAPTAPLPPPPPGGVTVTWIGHSTFLLQAARSTWLTDPVFSTHIGPVKNFGPRRAAPPAIPLQDLPKIDGILLTHDHYDHCDLPSLRAIGQRGRVGLFSPLNYGSLLGGAHRPDALASPSADRVQSAWGPCAPPLVELDWWETKEGPGGSQVELVPAQHWCRRSIGGANLRLWGGYCLRLEGLMIYFAGDTGFDERLFREVRARCGAPDLALLPIGAYEPRWFMREAHMNPEEAVSAHTLLGARRSIGMHYATFQLTDERYDAPAEALAAARAAAGFTPEDFTLLPLGGSLTI